MYKKELVSMCSLYAVSPMHAGSGSATGAVDLPIQRERHTNWPHVQASAVKGAMRAHFRNYASDKASINQIFGSDTQDKNYPGAGDGIPGAISVSDAKLLAFPVRSNIAPFVNVTSPGVLKRLMNDLKMSGIYKDFNLPESPEKDGAVSINFSPEHDRIVLEDALVTTTARVDIPFLKEKFGDVERLLLISDAMFDHVVTTCTEVQTQIKIDHEKGTAQDGALRYEELLPCDTALYAIVHYSPQNSSIQHPETQAEVKKLQARMIQTFIQENISDFIQIGGDETLGRGICRISWINEENETNGESRSKGGNA